ncbi:hypothetical protein HHK36_032425 [Tetracentron sinense]|uniref:GH18 domain-containing protein n=1 Tax=Tetracentron sinense TaxID=13715 RepID=A0A834YAS8_TETSI|nr:hypothetical protein HHK36_032425 [Tetracentron sinense]
MCFDYRGSWDTTVTGAHAALYDSKSNVSTSYGLGSWIKAGVPGKKMVMGLPLYGRTWKLEKPEIHGIGAPGIGVGPGDEGTMTFSQVMDFNRKNNATVVYDSDSVSMYSYAGTSWIGYDDSISVTIKIGFARAHGLTGYFFWAVNGDKDWKISRQDYLHAVKALADEIAIIDHPISDDDLTLYVLNGLGSDFWEIAAPIRARETPLAFEELHDLLVGHESYLQRLEAATQ